MCEIQHVYTFRLTLKNRQNKLHIVLFLCVCYNKGISQREEEEK